MKIIKIMIWITVSSLLLFSNHSLVNAENFKIEEVEVIERDIIELDFTRNLNTNLDAVREFIIENSETMEDIEVLLSEVDPSQQTRLTLMLSDFLEENTDYTITVIDISDVDWNTIEAWVDSIFTFNSWAFTFQSNNNDNEINEDDFIEDDFIEDEIVDDIIEDEHLDDLNSAPEFDTHNNNGLWWTTTNIDDAQSTLTHAENNEQLPDTWPEIIALLILTLLFTWWLFYMRNQRV